MKGFFVLRIRKNGRKHILLKLTNIKILLLFKVKILNTVFHKAMTLARFIEKVNNK